MSVSKHLRVHCHPALLVGLATLASTSVAQGQGLLQSNFGQTVGDGMGWSASSAGDVNADGYDDTIAGGFTALVNGQSLGRATVTSGKDGAKLYDLTGTIPLAGFGYDVAGAGDLDGDGFAEFVVTQRPFDYDNGGPGSAKVYSGKTGATLFTFTGAGTHNAFGCSVDSAGDVNKDGVPDLVIGSFNESLGGIAAGGIWVFSGASGAVLHHFIGAVGSQLGSEVAGAGDVNGDGYADIIGGGTADGTGGYLAGVVHVWSGKTGTKLWSKFGSAGDQVGAAVAGVGDVNGDGLPDVAYGAPSDDTQGNFSGMVRICAGATGAVIHTLLGVSGSGLGSSVAGLGDIDGDGRGDFLSGSPYANNGQGNSGSVTVYSGKTASLLFTFYGNAAGDWFGYDASSAGDINADGIQDILVGAFNDGLAGQAKGATYVYSGRCGPIASVGAGCPGSGGFIPSLAVTGCACPGGSMALSLTKAYGGSPTLLFLGVSPSSIAIPGGCTLLTFPIVTTIVVTLSGNGAGLGQLLAIGKVPMGSPLIQFRMQAISLDPLVARGYSTSNGVSITLE